MAEPKKPISPFASLGGILGAAGGWALGMYASGMLLIPGVATVLLVLLFTKTPFRPRYFKGAIATTGGHIIWFVVGSLIAHLWSTTGLDIVVLSVAILWLWLRPGLASALFLGIVQLGSLAYSLYLLQANAIGTTEHKALTVHCVWRLLALACLVAGYLKLRRERIAATSTPSLPEAI